MDRALHAARVGPDRRQVTTRALMAALSDRAFVDGPARMPGDGPRPWRPEGYGAPGPRPGGEAVVLTARPALAVLSMGHAPVLRPTAGG